MTNMGGTCAVYRPVKIQCRHIRIIPGVIAAVGLVGSHDALGRAHEREAVAAARHRAVVRDLHAEHAQAASFAPIGRDDTKTSGTRAAATPAGPVIVYVSFTIDRK